MMRARTKKTIDPMSAVHTAYCPHCRVVTNLCVSIMPGVVTAQDGEEQLVTSKTYHSCGLFVRSEEDAQSVSDYTFLFDHPDQDEVFKSDYSVKYHKPKPDPHTREA